MNHKLPEAFRERMRTLLGGEFTDLIAAYEKTPRKSLRICERKTTKEKFQDQAPFHVVPVKWVENGFYFDQSEGVSTHSYYKAGVYYITEASAMTPPDRFPIEKGDKVLDLCAAPGGKSFALAGKLNGTGLLFANEVNKSRAKALLYNLETTGYENLIITNEQPVRLEKKYPCYFDKILVDAPCSGEGMFRKDPEAIRTWSVEKVEQLAALQKSILASAVAMLRPGGMLMYSTCTFSPEENEENVSWLLDRYPHMQIMDIAPFEGFDHGRSEWANGDVRVEKAVRIWPHRMEAEGQFMALFQKMPEEEAPEEKGSGRKKRMNPVRKSFSKEERSLFEEFLNSAKIDLNKENLYSVKGEAYCIPAGFPDTEGLTVLRKGLWLGTFKKNRFEPSQSFAFYLSQRNCKNTLDLNAEDERVVRYLKGETLECENTNNKGWILILTDGYPLGFGKISGSQIKNKLLYSRMQF